MQVRNPKRNLPLCLLGACSASHCPRAIPLKTTPFFQRSHCCLVVACHCKLGTPSATCPWASWESPPQSLPPLRFPFFCKLTLLPWLSLQVKNPKRDLPLGILGALSVVTICYILMSLALVMMVPISALTESGSFAAAFDYAGLHWARYIVALGALLGIVTGTLCW